MKKYYEILLSAPAAQSIRTIAATDPVSAKMIADSLEFISADLEFGDSRAVDGETTLRRINMDDHFALYWIRHEDMTVIVLSVARRRGR